MLLTAGLNTQSAVALEQITVERDGVLVDVRLYPGAAPLHQRPSSLRELFGDRYQQIRSFGNINLLAGASQFLDPRRALAEFRRIRADYPERTPIILCSCWSWRWCHRRDVADFLIAEGEANEVRHLLRSDCKRVGCL